MAVPAFETNMSDKIKKAARERKKRTGESYTTALMHVRRQHGNGGEGDGPASPGGGGGGGRRSKVRKIIEEIIAIAARQPDDGTLRERLAALDWPDLRKVEVLTYAGRQSEDVLDLAADLKVDSPEITVRVIAGKALALAEYLRRGLDLADEQGVNLDAEWPEPDPAGWGSLQIRAYSRRWGRTETLTFARTDDGWHIANNAHNHPTRPDGSKWGRGRAAGHRGLGFFLVNDNYVCAGEQAIGEALADMWNKRSLGAADRERLQALFDDSSVTENDPFAMPVSEFIELLGRALADLAEATDSDLPTASNRVDTILRALESRASGYASEKVGDLRGYADHAAGRTLIPNVGDRAAVLAIADTAMKSLLDALRQDGVLVVGWGDSLN